MKQLFEKTNLLGFEAKNRFIRSATWENMTTEDGHMTEALYDIYEELAKNDVGTLITGYANIVPEEQPNAGMMGIYDDSFIEEYKKLTDLVHTYDSRIILQVAYGGTKTTYQIGERVIYAPSAVEERGTKTLGKEMTKEEIEYIVKAFGASARRAKESGFDAIEIHGAHTYLINQFLSPYYNLRTDEYGGSLENRMRFLKEIYAQMRAEVGEDYPIMVKLTATEFFEGGMTFEETRIVCKELENIGLQAIELSGNVHGSATKLVGEKFDGYEIEEEGYFYRYGEVVSREVSIPVITVGGFSNIESIENVIQKTNIEYVALSRPLLAEPDLIKRWQGEDKSKVKCIRCSKCRTATGNYCVVFNK
ncbi:MAG: NADH:flavin oxidoreductase [Eubacteriales bacterium]